MQLTEIMSVDPVVLPPEASLDEAMETMDRGGFRHLPVVDRGKLVGVVSDRDLLAVTGWLERAVRVGAGAGPVAERARGSVGELARRREPIVLETFSEAWQAARVLVDEGIGCLPLLEDGRLVGIVTERDVLRAYVRVFGKRPGEPTVASCMTRTVLRADTTTPLEEAIEMCRGGGIRHLVVVEAGRRVIGIVSDRDLRLAEGRGEADETPVADLISDHLHATPPTTPLPIAAGRLADHAISALPILDRSELKGILTTTDVLRHAAQALR